MDTIQTIERLYKTPLLELQTPKGYILTDLFEKPDGRWYLGQPTMKACQNKVVASLAGGKRIILEKKP